MCLGNGYLILIKFASLMELLIWNIWTNGIINFLYIIHGTIYILDLWDFCSTEHSKYSVEELSRKNIDLNIIVIILTMIIIKKILKKYILGHKKIKHGEDTGIIIKLLMLKSP